MKYKYVEIFCAHLPIGFFSTFLSLYKSIYPPKYT